MFSQILARLRQYRQVQQPRRAEAIGDIIDAKLKGKLPADFQRTEDLVWVSAPTAKIRYLLQIQAMKGLMFSANWGVSIDFVPRFSGGGQLAWKRTAKSSDCDLTFDPIDLSGSIPPWCSFSNTASRYQIEKVAIASFSAASLDWSKITTLEDVAASFDQRSKMTFQRFSLENYIQTDLAWGLILIALRRNEEGEGHLRSFCENFSVASENPILVKARAAAAAFTWPNLRSI